MKSALGSGKQANWRLKKTLARRLEFRPIENDDVKYVWAAYKKGLLVEMAGPFLDRSMTADKFKETFEKFVLENFDAAWTMFAETSRGFIPVGVLFAFLCNKVMERSPFMIVGDLVWCPWASPRNRIESAVNFFAKTRNEFPMMDYAYGEKNKKFFAMICKHGVMQRVGTTFNVKRGEPVAIFETRV